MKVLVIENSLDDLLNVKISVNGGQSYTDYNVSSLKNGGLTLDCNPSDLKVICDTNILNYIKVFADGEKLNTGSCGVNTYAHKVEIKFDNMSLSYYGRGESIYTIDFTDIADGTTGYNGVSVSGDIQEISNFYPVMRSPDYGGPYTEESKIAYHIYLKDADTENLVRGIGLVWSTYENVEELGVLFNSGKEDKYFTNTLVIEWGLEVSSGGSSSQTTIKELSVTENGTYNAGSNAAYNPVIVNVPSGGGGDKLLCYYADHQDPRCRVVYTDKPATQLSYRVVEDEGFVYSVLPKDEGKHLFITSLSTSGYELKSMNLIYEDGSTSADLKGKFIYI